MWFILVLAANLHHEIRQEAEGGKAQQLVDPALPCWGAFWLLCLLDCLSLAWSARDGDGSFLVVASMGPQDFVDVLLNAEARRHRGVVESYERLIRIIFIRSLQSNWCQDEVNAPFFVVGLCWWLLEGLYHRLFHWRCWHILQLWMNSSNWRGYFVDNRIQLHLLNTRRLHGINLPHIGEKDELPFDVLNLCDLVVANIRKLQISNKLTLITRWEGNLFLLGDDTFAALSSWADRRCSVFHVKFEDQNVVALFRKDVNDSWNRNVRLHRWKAFSLSWEWRNTNILALSRGQLMIWKG